MTIVKRTVFDYSNDTKWLSFNQQAIHYKALLKEREELLKEIPPGEIRQIVDAQTGEVEEVIAPVAATILGLNVKLWFIHQNILSAISLRLNVQ